jgi:hypothetical protein
VYAASVPDLALLLLKLVGAALANMDADQPRNVVVPPVLVSVME